MSQEFRELLKTIGSGIHTHKDLNRQQASMAMEMMLTAIATPAQIGAFLIAHRIKRPTGEELAGMLDIYSKRGIELSLIDKFSEVMVLGIPYDGRSRTAPISPLTTLALTALGIPVIMHGGERMPTKYGLHLAHIWEYLGVNVTQGDLNHIQRCLSNTNFAFVYLPSHFPLAHNLVKYREEIGKRPPLATLELIWQPYQGKTHLMAGYVHPPTEKMIRQCLALRGVKKFTLIKGLEGSPDLKLSQTNIIAIDNDNLPDGFEYLKLNPRDYGYISSDPVLEDEEKYLKMLQKTIEGETTQLTMIGVWNIGFYLWRWGVFSSLREALKEAENLLISGELKQQLGKIRQQNRYTKNE